jgi:hypothetical protein
MMLKKLLLLFAIMLCTGLAAWAESPDLCSITPTDDGSMRFKNSIIDLKASSQIGRDNGITEWRFLSTEQDMIDRNRTYKSILGEGWDNIEFRQTPGGMPFSHSDIYAPLAQGSAADGSAVGIIQEYKKEHRLVRTMLMRRDYSAINVTWQLENISGKPVGGAFRFFSAWFPGALTGTTFKGTSIFMPTEQGVLELDQDVHRAAYKEKYGDTNFFQKRWAEEKEPLRTWAGRKLKTPFANDFWSCEVNRNNGNGMFLLSDPKTLIGYHNDPQTTLETVMEAVALQPGEKWQTSILVGAFAVPKGMKVSSVNALFITCGENGIVPLFKGTLKNGNKEYPAAPNVLISVKPADLADVSAFDTQGKLIGTVRKGVCAMAPEDIKYVVPEKPWFWGKIYNPEREQVSDFLKKRDFTVYCGFNNREDVKKLAEKIALQIGTGIAYSNPGGKMLAIGAAEDDTLIRNIGLMNNSVSDVWPGTGCGAIRYFSKLGFTLAEAVTLAGSDTDGALLAIEKFITQHLDGVKAPSGYALTVTTPERKVFPYSRPDANVKEKIIVEGARGEYESAQLMLTAFSAQKNIRVEFSDLINVKTGQKISDKYNTVWRKNHGPILLRWVDYFPFEPKEGSSGLPDPLFERAVTLVPAGKSQAIWLTFIIPETAEAGNYSANIVCKTDDGEKTIPIELTVWDFNISREGMMGRAYTSLASLAKKGKILTDNQIDLFIQNMVEHGMRFINLDAPEMFRWNFSKEGNFKAMDVLDFEVSKDGKVMLDASYFDQVKERCDRAGQPYKLIYAIAVETIIYGAWNKFQNTFPERHEKREGNGMLNSRYTEEMLTMLYRHLEKRGWLKDIYVKVSDEPGNIHKWYNELCQATVGSKLQLFTAHGSSDLTTATPDMSDFWMPIYASYNEEFMNKARKAGKLIGFYNCGPPPTTAVGAPAAEWRSYLWQAARLDIDIVCWWGIQCWSYYDGGEALWRDYYSHWNSVVYPEHPIKKPFYVATGKNRGWKDTGKIDSIRWELIREGMEDAWYVNLLRKEIAQARARGQQKAADDADFVLNKIWKDVYPTRNDYRPDYALILQARKLVAEEILRLQAIKVK